jgi:F-type H+-transporting ATPase subunit b
MEIDWITVIAQVVNFLILVYLLKRFLYGPIIRAMDRREARIGSRLEEAQQRERDAEAKVHSFERKRQELDEQEATMLQQASEDAEEQRKHMVAEARAEIERLRHEWRDEIEREKNEFLRSLRDMARREVMQVARRVLNELAERELEQEIVRVFAKRLQQLDEDTREALSEHNGELEVVTAFALEGATKERLSEALGVIVGDVSRIDFRQNDDLICGIALRAGGRKISWSVDEYLDALDGRMQETLDRNKNA